MARRAVWLFGCSAAPPLLAAPAAGRLRGGMGVEAPMLRELTRRGCPSGAAQQQSEFHGAPSNRPDAGLPRSEAQGSQTGGRPFFGDFLSATRKKVTRTPGDSRPPPSTQACLPNQHAPASTGSARTDRRPKTTKTIAASAYLTSASSHFHPKNQSPTSNRLPYCTRLVCFNAFIITFAAGDNSRSDRVMIPNASIWHGIASGNTVTIPCAA